MNIDRVFGYHAPTPEQVGRMDAVRAKAKELAKAIEQAAPDCEDKSAALRHLRECTMTANAAIVLGGKL
jgi:hypothetical protein